MNGSHELGTQGPGPGDPRGLRPGTEPSACSFKNNSLPVPGNQVLILLSRHWLAFCVPLQIVKLWRTCICAILKNKNMDVHMSGVLCLYIFQNSLKDIPNTPPKYPTTLALWGPGGFWGMLCFQTISKNIDIWKYENACLLKLDIYRFFKVSISVRGCRMLTESAARNSKNNYLPVPGEQA